MIPRSHSCEFGAPDVLRLAARLGLGVLLAAAVLHLLHRLEWLPAPVPGDVDRTILAAKARLALEAPPASLVMIGDSSCLMDVDAPLLSRLIAPGSALNLGTLSYLDLPAHGALLDRFVRRHPGSGPATVLVLLHPEALRWGSPRDEFTGYLRNRLDPTRPREALSPARGVADAWLGGPIFRERILHPLLPVPLPGPFGVGYGCNRDLGQTLIQRQGSLTDPERFDAADLQGNAEYRLGSSIETASRAFTRFRPPGARLVVGITPVPEGFAARDHDAKVRAMLETWAGWMGADRALTNLPGRLPNSLFATHTHLNAEGADLFTRRLAEELRPTADPQRPQNR
jgi:hypothetical protein